MGAWPKRVVDVLVPVALDQSYSYRVPEALELAPGDIVSVPLGARAATAVVWAENPKPNPRLDNRLKDVAEKLDLPPLRDELRRFVDWVANYTVASRGMVLRMCLRMGEHLGAERERVGVRLAGPPPQRLTGAAPAGARAARRRHGARQGRCGARSRGEHRRDRRPDRRRHARDRSCCRRKPVAEKPDPDFARPDFSGDQSAAAAALTATLAKGGYAVTLLDGVTGSGKTEVYFEAVADRIRRGRQSLILMPEIALTAQFLDRFAARFGVRPAEWHSELSPRRRARTWKAVADGDISVVVGARSALFLPYADLGLIVVDEEHDPAYKQEDGVHYHARDMAVVRGHIAGIPVVLSSATPSLETEVNARRGRYQRLALPERFGGQRMPAVEAIDLRRERPPPGRFIAPDARRRGQERARARRAGAVFPQPPRLRAAHALPRLRLPLLLPELRRLAGRSPLSPAARLPPLRLRHAAPGRMPEMPGQGFIRGHRPGVERLEEEVRELFPHARVLVLSSDLVATVDRLREELDDVAQGRFDIVIGTQLVAKGHHFPKLNLVGIVDADLGLANGDPRAAERTFQLLHQVVGRAGRDAGVGRGYLQTHQPEHPVIRALIAQDRDAFYAAEIDARERTQYPPFGRLASLVVSGEDKHATHSFARLLARAAPAHAEVRILGPADAPLSLVRGRHRMRLLIKSPRAFDLSAYLREWLAAAPKPKGSIRLDIDIDPQSFL